jgi:hypothetical protein
MSILWLNIKNCLPTLQDIKDNKLILTYSPAYEDEQDVYRLVSAQFVKKCTDVTHWTYLKPPKEN